MDAVRHSHGPAVHLARSDHDPATIIPPARRTSVQHTALPAAAVTLYPAVPPPVPYLHSHFWGRDAA